ncbi:DUF167 family protein YggU [Aliivibrio sifiae]|uniref:UPF0235 protein BTO22_01475 n=1 Tax=Aliivibrio sifiae TaxID=566293 RepID=A0A2S7XFG8_9GAMM|nr:DUF167 family protein YggU [Aliivibrio sifiae]PQJ90103.1 YggU family protein [Aliivibrio sifiae]
MPVKYDNDDLILRLYLQPKASRDQIVGIHGEELKIAITAPPVDGKANAHLIKYFSKLFKVAKGKITVEKGELNRHKQVRIHSPEIIPEAIKQLLPSKKY